MMGGVLALSLMAIVPTNSGAEPDLVVEAFVAEAEDPLLVSYAVATGEISDESGVTLSFTSDSPTSAPPLQLAPGPGGIFVGTVRYPASALWTVTVVVYGHQTREAVFTENLPWPHYTTEAGHPKVKYDSGDPGREGSLVAPEQSIYLAAVNPARGDSRPWVVGLGILALGLVGLWWRGHASGRPQPD